MRGRKPGVKSLTAANGLPNPEVPQPPRCIPNCPPQIKGAARIEWRRLTKALHELGFVTPLDRSTLAIICQAWATWAKAQEELDRDGMFVEANTGAAIQNPWLAVQNNATKTIIALMGEYGLTTAARARMKAVKQDSKTATGWEGLIADAG